MLPSKVLRSRGWHAGVIEAPDKSVCLIGAWAVAEGISCLSDRDVYRKFNHSEFGQTIARLIVADNKEYLLDGSEITVDNAANICYGFNDSYREGSGGDRWDRSYDVLHYLEKAEAECGWLS